MIQYSKLQRHKKRGILQPDFLFVPWKAIKVLFVSQKFLVSIFTRPDLNYK